MSARTCVHVWLLLCGGTRVCGRQRKVSENEKELSDDKERTHTYYRFIDSMKNRTHAHEEEIHYAELNKKTERHR